MKHKLFKRIEKLGYTPNCDLDKEDYIYSFYKIDPSKEMNNNDIQLLGRSIQITFLEHLVHFSQRNILIRKRNINERCNDGILFWESNAKSFYFETDRIKLKLKGNGK